MRSIKRALALLMILGANGCTVTDTPTSQTYVLVDLSETWHAPQFRERNLRTLQEVGNGIVLASDAAEPPVAIEYRVIGANSLERPPLCEAVYNPSMAPGRTEVPYEIKNRRDLISLLDRDCPQQILVASAEPMTEISSAIASVASQPRDGASRRNIIILSDMLEEVRTPMALNTSLSGFRVLLVYRPVSDDNGNPAPLAARVEQWRRLLADRGAVVQVMPDTSIRRTSVAAFLTGSGS